MSEQDQINKLNNRVSACEDGLTAVETILRVTFPQFFAEENSGEEKTDTEATPGAGEGSGETPKEASEETEYEKKVSTRMEDIERGPI